MLSEGNVVWQPTHLHEPHYDFEILISRPFAGEMLETVLNEENRGHMNKMGGEILRRYKYSGSSPYRFHESTAFVRQITADGSRGTWLELEGQLGRKPDLSIEKPLKYTTHNMDSSSDTLVLLSLFELWIYYADTLKQLNA